MATQNPIEQEGTYALPEAQLDRFMLMVNVTYPTKKEERQIMDQMTSPVSQEPEEVSSLDEVLAARRVLSQIYVDEKIRDYIVDVVFATREPAAVGLDKLGPLILYGASPRASLALVRAARARAFLEGRGFVTPQDVKAIGMPILRHRVIPTYEAEAEEMSSEDLLKQIFDHVPVP